MSTFPAASTPVTSAPWDFAIWTAKMPHVSPSAIDKDMITDLNRTLGAEALERHHTGLGHGRRLLEGESAGLRRECILGGTHELCERAVAMLGQISEHLVTSHEPRHLAADRLHDPCDIDPKDRVRGCRSPVISRATGGRPYR